MEVTTTPPKQQASIKRTSSDDQKASGLKGGASQQSTEAQALNADKSSTVANDTVNLSAGALNLSKSITDQASNDAPTIDSREKARQAVDRLVSNIRNNPQLALAAYGNESGDRLKALLQ